MAEAATGDDLQKVTDQLKENKDKASQDAIAQKEHWTNTVQKTSDIATKVAEKTHSLQMKTFEGIKSSLGFVGKTLGGMSLIASKTFDMAKRAGKASRLMEFGKAAVKPVTDAFKGGISTLMDFLSTLGKLGLFLAAGGLLELFTNKKWQEFLKKMWTDMVEKVKKWWEDTDFRALFDTFKTKFKEWYDKTVQPHIDELIKKLKGWMDEFMVWYNTNIKPIIDKLIGKQGDTTSVIEEMGTTFESWLDTWNKVRTAMLALNMISWFGPLSPLRLIFSGLKLLFGVDTPLDEAAKATKTIKNAKLFGEGSALRRMWTGLKGIFGLGGQVGTSAINVEGWKESNMFKKESALQKMWNGIKGIFGAEGKIATMWKGIKEGATFSKWFGEGSTLKNLFTSFKGFFGPESAIGKAGKWISDLMKPVKEALMGGAKGGGAVSKVMGVFNWVFDGIKGVGKTIAKIAGPILKLMGKGLTIAATIAKPFSFLMWPITAVLAAGAAVFGFVKGFMGTEGGLGDKIIGGFKGALQGLIDFFVVDIAVMIQDILNWFIEKIPGAGKIIDKFTFGDDIKKASDSFIGKMVDNVADGFGVGKGAVTKATLEQSDFVKAGLGTVADAAGVGTGDVLKLDPKKLTKYMEAMTVEKLKSFGSQLGKIEGAKGMKVENMAAIQKQLMLKLTEKTEAAKTAALNQIDASTANISKPQTIVAGAPNTIDPVVGYLQEVQKATTG